MEHFQFRRFELRTHLVDFFDAYPMLAGDRTPGLYAHLEYLRAEFLSKREFSRPVGIIKNQGVQIPITSMKNIHASQTIFTGEGFNTGQHVRQPFAGNGAVHTVIVRRYPSRRRKCRLAPGPESESLRLILRSPYLGGAAPVHDLIDSLDLFSHLFSRAIGFA